MELRLEVGNVYKDRLNRRIKITAFTGDPHYPFIGAPVDKDGRVDVSFSSSFSADGQYDVRIIDYSDYDLISLVEPLSELGRVLAELEDTKKQLKDLQDAVRSALERNV